MILRLLYLLSMIYLCTIHRHGRAGSDAERGSSPRQRGDDVANFVACCFVSLLSRVVLTPASAVNPVRSGHAGGALIEVGENR